MLNGELISALYIGNTGIEEIRSGGGIALA